jgi:hypothetical protein
MILIIAMLELSLVNFNFIRSYAFVKTKKKKKNTIINQSTINNFLLLHNDISLDNISLFRNTNGDTIHFLGDLYLASQSRVFLQVVALKHQTIFPVTKDMGEKRCL